MLDMKKCAIIGCGNVGATTAYSLLQSGLFSDLLLLDINHERAIGEAEDLGHAMPFLSPASVRAADYPDLSDAGLIIITAGAAQRVGETRLDLLRRNAAVFRDIVEKICRYNSDAILLVVTNPVDILDRDELEKELHELGTMRSKADAIVSHMTKSIKVNRDENPAYYDTFSKRIKDALEEYKNRVITEAEYLAKMKSIMEDYRKGTTNITYPEKIKGNVHAQAFYGVITAILDDVMDISANIDVISDISIRITEIVDEHNMVDWQTNKDIHNKIAQGIDDMFYEIEKEKGIQVDFDSIDKIIENVITVALRRFK